MQLNITNIHIYISAVYIEITSVAQSTSVPLHVNNYCSKICQNTLGIILEKRQKRDKKHVDECFIYEEV